MGHKISVSSFILFNDQHKKTRTVEHRVGSWRTNTKQRISDPLKRWLHSITYHCLKCCKQIPLTEVRALHSISDVSSLPSRYMELQFPTKAELCIDTDFKPCSDTIWSSWDSISFLTEEIMLCYFSDTQYNIKHGNKRIWLKKRRWCKQQE